MSDDGNMGLNLLNPLERRTLRKLLKADVAGYDRQIAALNSQIRTLEAEAKTLEAYRRRSEAKLAALGDDDEDREP